MFVVADAVLRVADDVRGTPPVLFGDLWMTLRDCLESRILRSASGGRASTEETSPRTGSSRKTEHLLDIYSGIVRRWQTASPGFSFLPGFLVNHCES